MIQVNIGDQFADLMVISEAGKNNQGKRLFSCQCSCGKIITVLIYDLVRGHTKSCGCLKKISIKKAHAANTKHNINLNDVFERLTVIGFDYSPGNRIVQCKCICGNLTSATVSNLINGGVKSCGCLHKDIVASENPWLTEMNIYSHHCAVKRNLAWELSLEFFTKIVQQECFYCGQSPSTITKVGKLKRNGIDRVDNTIGYLLDNCVPCCKQCNHAKCQLSKKEFLDWINRVYIKSRSQ